MATLRSLLGVAGLVLVLLAAMAAAAPAQDPAVVNADLITVKLDNPRVRVFEAVLEPGQREQLHAHPSTVVHVIAGGKIRSHGVDGTVTESELGSGETVYRDPVTHWAENIGSTTVRVLVVELKEHDLATPAPRQEQ